MALTIIQNPGAIVPSQSPIAFSVLSPSYTGSQFQYTAKLFCWSGSQSNSGSYLYEIRKYPNANGYGIFDFGRVLSSQIRDSAQENPSNVLFYSIEFGQQWYEANLTGSVAVSGSTTYIDSAGLQKLRFIDGYNTFPRDVNLSIDDSNDAFPLMTDMIYVTQSVLATDRGDIGLFTGNWNGKVDTKSLVFTGQYEDGSSSTSTISVAGLPSSASTEQVKPIQIYPGGRAYGNDPLAGGFPLSITGLKSYTIQLTGGNTNAKQIFSVDINCIPKWKGYFIKYKNKYGQFDFLSMMNMSRESFQTEQRVYQPQLGSWNSAALSYDKFQTKTQRYIVDSEETITMNSDWLDENWNQLLKQLLVSDELYYLDKIDQEWRPLTIVTSAIEFKTGVNDKLIQYTIQFSLGQTFKQIF
jgi:hypothetical protein